LVVVDTMYEVYLEKKREQRHQIESNSDGRKIVSHFSMNEEDMILFDLFGDNQDDMEGLEQVLAEEDI